uniref:Uncharacterized protein n=1 Tax=Timema bartmani TaxID=61472 RepID=A0A7R9FCW1_9NEOP|nr:unnamed protein product [Timema bartmani]
MIVVGNILVQWGRFFSKNENKVLNLVIRNLAGKQGFESQLIEDTTTPLIFFSQMKLTNL